MSTDGLNSCRPEPNGNSTVAQTFGSQTGASGNGILPILPVQVKARRGNKVIQTYAFLDNGSTSTFCTEALMRKLNLTGKKKKKSRICLLTMSPKTSVSTYIVKELEIFSLNGKRYHSLPNVYTQKTMPVNTTNIIKKENLTNWSLLTLIRLTTLKSRLKWCC